MTDAYGIVDTPYKNILVALASNCIEDCGIPNIQIT
jgi:hypothetical protein